MENNDTIRIFQDLRVWQQGHELVLMIYRITKSFPDDEKYGLTSQLRRAAVSITSNIAEGFTRYSYKEKIRFYNIALASLVEIQNQFCIARDVGYFSEEVFDILYEKTVVVQKMLQAIIRSSKIRLS